MTAPVLSRATLERVTVAAVDAAGVAEKLARQFGLVRAPIVPTDEGGVVLATRGVMIQVTPIDANARTRAFVDRHGDGVVDIALSVADVDSAHEAAVRDGVRSVVEPHGAEAHRTAVIEGFGDVTHTLLTGQVEDQTSDLRSEPGLQAIDHLAVCVPYEDLDPTVEFYQDLLGFEQTFTESIAVGDQAMDSKVVQNATGTVTLTIVAPTPDDHGGQIASFLERNGGTGVQHIAFSCRNIFEGVQYASANGAEFLRTPDAYYDDLAPPAQDRHSLEQLREHSVLVDSDHGGELYQIFTKSEHERNTLFHELIERQGATTFGSGNIRALYEAVARNDAAMSESVR